MSTGEPIFSSANEKSAGSKTGLSYLLAYDSSEHAQAAVNLLLDLSKNPLSSAHSNQVTMLSVLPTQGISPHETMQAAIERDEQRLKAAGFQTKSVLIAGNPAATINTYAEQQQSDLIVIGAKGLRSALGILLGGVAQQVVEYSNSPVLVVRAPYNGLHKILLVVDGSTPSKQAVEYLVPLCPGGERQRCSWLPASVEVTVMHVLPPPITQETTLRAWALGPEALYPAPIAPLDTASLEAAEERNGEALLAQTLDLLRMGKVEAESLMVRGDAAEEILEMAQSKNIDLIVCGSRGLSAISGWLLGSVSRKLVHYANCSVLIIK